MSPVTERSAIVIRKFLLATVGSFKRRLIASLSFIVLLLNSFSLFGSDETSLKVFGVDPKSKDISRSIGLFLK